MKKIYFTYLKQIVDKSMASLDQGFTDSISGDKDYTQNNNPMDSEQVGKHLRELRAKNYKVLLEAYEMLGYEIIFDLKIEQDL